MSHWWWQEGQNCSSAPVKVVPWYLGTLAGTSEPLNKGVDDIKFEYLKFEHTANSIPQERSSETRLCNSCVCVVSQLPAVFMVAFSMCVISVLIPDGICTLPHNADLSLHHIYFVWFSEIQLAGNWVIFTCISPRPGSGVVRIDLLCFLAGCRTRRLNQV